VIGSLSIVVDEQIPLAEKIFSIFGTVHLVDGRTITNSLIKDADILLVRSVTKVDESLLRNTNVKFLGTATSGIDHIDVDYLKASKIFFSYSPGSNSRSVAEYVLNSLIMAKTASHPSFSEMKIGIIGYGNIGSKVKKNMDIFGSSSLLNDPILYEKTKDKSLANLEHVLESDVITMHVPLTRDGAHPTYNLVDENFLDQLKSNVIFINTSRGEVVDEDALLSFKKRNPKSTIVLDVWRNEPQINTELLKQAFIRTPHIAGYSYEGKIKATRSLFNDLNDFYRTNFSFSALFNQKNIILSPKINSLEYTAESIISQHWNILEDNISLSYCNLEKDERGKHFDSLRKNYPTRYEYASRVISINKSANSVDLNIDVQDNLKKLGFKFSKK